MNFLKWLTITTVYVVSLIAIEYNYQYFQSLFAGDSTPISMTITCLFFLGMAMSCFYSLQDNPKFKKILRLAGVCTMLGLLGSILGFSETFDGLDLQNLDTSNDNQMKSLMGSIASGIPTALNTTVMGIYAALGLIGYPFFIRKNDD